MLSISDSKNKIATSIEAYNSQSAKVDGNGKNNVVIDGSGVGNITTQADETVVLLAEGDDLVFAESDSNKIEAQAGNNTIQVVGGKNTVKTDNGDNKISVTGNINFIHTSDGNNTINLTGDASTITTKTGNNDIASIGSNNIIKTQTGDNQVVSVGSYNSISTATGNNKIYSFGNNNAINTQSGDNTIMSGGNSNAIKAEDGNNYIVSGGYTKTESGYMVSGKGNNNVIQGGSGDDKIYSTGDNNIINGGNGSDIIQSFGDYNKISGGDDTKSNGILSIGEGNIITGGLGSDAILSIGDDTTINAREGNNSIVFNGNHQDITAGNGNNYISTLDFAIMNQTAGSPFNYANYADYLDDRTSVSVDSTLISSESEYVVLNQTTSTTSNLQNIIEQLPDYEKALLDSIDLTETTSNGSPKYLIAKGKSDGLYHIYQYKSSGTYTAVAGFNSKGSRDYTNVKSGNGYLYINSGTTKTGETTTVSTEKQLVTNNVWEDTTTTTITGVEDVNIKIGTGSNAMTLNVSKDLTIDGVSAQINEKGEYVNNNKDSLNNIFVTGEIVAENKEQREETVKDTAFTTTTSTTASGIMVGGTYSTGSPLIVDFNKDGKISAIAGQGVDIDNNGYADGAATDGDKMLAMSDINGNGLIDGGEVFGDQTISPFTGEKLNAANGFEALKLIAEQAEQYTGISCLNNGNVNLAELQKALQTVGINLGFISDGNITELEDLAHVASINVENYDEQEETGEVQHRQIGSYTDTNGNTYETDDVWFKLFGKE